MEYGRLLEYEENNVGEYVHIISLTTIAAPHVSIIRIFPDDLHFYINVQYSRYASMDLKLLAELQKWRIIQQSFVTPTVLNTVMTLSQIVY